MSIEMDKSKKAIAELAAEWFIRSRDTEFSDSEQMELARWLRDSPVHVHEYLAIARIWGDVAAIQNVQLSTGTSPNQLDVPVSNVVSLDVTAEEGQQYQPSTAASTKYRKNRGWSVAIAASVLVAIGIGVIGFWRPWVTAEYHATALGEQRSIVLADSSLVEMNTSSEIAVSYEDSERVITLLTGEVFFDVRKDENRPFVVRAGDAEIRVRGTRFNVYRGRGETTVTVVEGRVAVSSGQSGATGPVGRSGLDDDGVTVTLSSGEQAIIDETVSSIKTEIPTNLGKYVAWTDRRLIFERTRLDKILSEFSRYNSIEYQIDNDDVASIQLTATFDSQNLDSLIAYLKLHPDVSVVRYGNKIVIGTAR